MNKVALTISRYIPTVTIERLLCPLADKTNYLSILTKLYPYCSIGPVIPTSDFTDFIQTTGNAMGVYSSVGDYLGVKGKKVKKRPKRVVPLVFCYVQSRPLIV